MTRNKRRRSRRSRKRAAQTNANPLHAVRTSDDVLAPPSSAAQESAQAKGSMAGHTFWAALSSWGTRITTLLVFAILSRLLSPDAIGVLAFAFVIYSQLSLLPACFSEYLMWKRDATPAQESTVFWIQMTIASIAALALGVSGYLWGKQWIDHPDAAAIFVIFAAQIPINVAASIPDVLLRRRFAFKLSALRNLTAAILGGIVGITCAWQGYGVWSLVWKQLVEMGFATVFLFIAARWMPIFRIDRKSLTTVLRYGTGVAGSWTIRSLASSVDTLLIGTKLGPNVLGYYNVGTKPFGILWELINGVTMQVAYPHMAAVSRDRKALTQMHMQMARITMLISAPAFAALGALAPQLIPLLFGRHWEKSAILLQIFCIAGLASGVSIFSNDLLMASGRVASSLRLNLVYLLTTTTFVYIGSRFGIEYVAAGHAFETYLTLPIGLLVARKVSDFRLSDLPRIMAPGLTAAAVLFTTISAVDRHFHTDNSILRLAITSGAGLVSLLLTWRIVAPDFLRTMLQAVARVLSRR